MPIEGKEQLETMEGGFLAKTQSTHTGSHKAYKYQFGP